MFTLGVQEYVELIENKKNGITLLSALAIMTVVILSAIPMFAFAEEEGSGAQVAGMEDGEKDTAGLTSHSTEYIAIAGISITAAWFVSSTVNKIRKTSFASIAVLSIAVGVVHLLLVEEHSAESPIWGIGFLVMGISQIVYGGVMVFTKRLLRTYSIKRLFYGIGMAGNALFVGIFVLARTTGIFSPDGTPVNELELNGLMSIIIELLIVASLGYLVKDKKEKQEVEDLMHFSSNRRRQIP